MQIIDYDMPYEQFVEVFEGIHAEWVDGVVYQLPKRSVKHQNTQRTLTKLLDSYLSKNPIGKHVSAPTLLRVNSVASARCPDLQVLLGDNTRLKQGREVIGAADIVIEIISEYNDTSERGDKFIEYEQGGVSEYWIIDPIRQDCLFYQLESRYFRRLDTDTSGIYHSRRLEEFNLPTQFLWSQPSDDKITELVKSM